MKEGGRKTENGNTVGMPDISCLSLHIMLGRDHVICNGSITITVLTASASGLASQNEYIQKTGETVLSCFIPEEVTLSFENGFFHEAVIYIVLAGLLLWLGSLLPDIDSKNSMLGRYVHLPFKHRTWTHSLIACILIGLLGLVHPLFRFLVLGFYLHIFMDALSRGGVCLLYPVQKYKTYENGAFVADGHYGWKLYRTGETSENVMVAVVVIICIIICIICRSGFPELWTWIFT